MSTPPQTYQEQGGVTDEHAKRNALIAKGRDLAYGKYSKPRGRLLGRLDSWGLDVYEGSPAPWRDALYAESRAGNGTE